MLKFRNLVVARRFKGAQESWHRRLVPGIRVRFDGETNTEQEENKKKESKGTVYEERPDVSVNVLGSWRH